MPELNPDAVANRLILTAIAEKRPLTPLQLQKHVYLAHGWHLGLVGTPLIDEHVEAWKYGPVVPTLWGEFKSFGDSPITKTVTDVEWKDGSLSIVIPDLDEGSEAWALVDAVWQRHRGLSAAQLVALTHEPGGPWHQVAAMYGFNLPPRVRIPNDLIKDYFSKRAK